MKYYTTTSKKCPCDSGSNYRDCCQKYIAGRANPPTALTLMRSRYTAFVLLDESYLRYSWHPDNCPNNIFLDSDDQWLGLKIKSTYEGNTEDKTGEVEFIARCKKSGKARRLHENSFFVKKHNRWFYVGVSKNRETKHNQNIED